MKQFIFAFLPGILFYTQSILGQEKYDETYWSVRVLGLTRHLIDVSYNSGYFPLKLDEEAVYLFNPGILVGFDKTIANSSNLYLRTVQSFYIDCAAQPASYVATMVFKQPVFEYAKFSLGAGVGGGINIRRNWQKYGKSGIKTRLLKDWGYFEGIVGPCIEIEMAYAISEKKQWILNIVPAYPVLIFITTGMRIKT